MHDGQNLFDDATSFAGEWQVDETMEALAGEGLEPIVVGIANAGDDRAAEYAVDGGRGADYLDFLVETVKPLVDAGFPTLPGRETTALVGSSLGGLISLYGFFLRPETFGLAGAMSPALWWAKGAVLETVQRAPFVEGRIYMDAGATERAANFKRMVTLLEAKGYGPDRFRHLVDPGGTHHGSSWARRLPAALRFLLSK
jgi:predicted alpha/beta superfamily hydrolase